MPVNKKPRMEAVNDAPYFRNRSESFVDSADVILELDSGERLPAHSFPLSFHSGVLSDMLSLKTSGDSPFQVLPLPECTLDAALRLLDCIYANSRDNTVSVEGAEAVLELVNKFGMTGILKDIDSILADKAAADGSSSALWGGDVNEAVHWLIMACCNNMMRLAARAERFLLQADARLSDSPEAVHIPPSLLLHMLDSHHGDAGDCK
ncbi:hypothetical protein COCOBI_16-4120 [Coccomyxa sp. Obi]|nr:hypothetical protein COCOBI_16-4120 [Coccomyxa sp. Obi]